jgi:hypothetical protein
MCELIGGFGASEAAREGSVLFEREREENPRVSWRACVLHSGDRLMRSGYPPPTPKKLNLNLNLNLDPLRMTLTPPPTTWRSRHLRLLSHPAAPTLTGPTRHALPPAQTTAPGRCGRAGRWPRRRRQPAAACTTDQSRLRRPRQLSGHAGLLAEAACLSRCDGLPIVSRLSHARAGGPD